MSAPNGHAHKAAGSISASPPAVLGTAVFQVPPERIKEMVAALEVPFDPSQIEWRVMNTTKNQQPVRGQVVPYADQRAYTDRLNALFTPAGWTRKYTIHTSANFERSKDQKIAAKVLVTCELTIFGLGSHSALEKNGPMTTMPEPQRKRRRSREPAHASASGVICITSQEPGLIWMTASGPRRFHNWRTGQRRKDGCGVSGLVEMGIHRYLSGQPPTMVVIAMLMTTATPQRRKTVL